MSSEPPPMQSPHGFDPRNEPAMARLGDVRARVDAALQRIRDIEDASVFSGVLERSLSEALKHVYAALSSTGDWRAFRDAIDVAKAQLDVAESYLGAVPSEDAATAFILEVVRESLDALTRLGLDMGEALELPSMERREAWIPASRTVPRLISIARVVVRPAVPVEESRATALVEKPPPPPTPTKTPDEMRALASRTEQMLTRLPSGPKPKPAPPAPEEPSFDDARHVRERFGIALTDRQLMAERARDYLDDLSMLGRMRRPSALEPWATGSDSEERMLTKIDAIVACGVEAFPELVRALDDRPIPDPELTFGNVLFFGCIAGDDAFEQAKRLIEVSDVADAAMFEMIVDALVFAPHPKIDLHLPSWLTSDDADRRALAAEVLSRRGTLSGAALNTAARDTDPRVLASAVRALAPRPHKEAVLGGTGLLGFALGHSDEHVVRAALETAMLLRAESGYRRAVALVGEGRGEFADAAMIVALTGDPRDTEALVRCVGPGNLGSLRALGWHGDASVAPLLLARLEAGDPSTKTAAAEALFRLTGAVITDAEPAPRYTSRNLPFRRARRNLEPVPRLLEDHVPWRAWWSEHGHLARPNERYRFGHRYSAQDSMWELSHDEFLYRDRPFAAMELACRGGVPPDWLAWVSVQRAQIGAFS